MKYPALQHARKVISILLEQNKTAIQGIDSFHVLLLHGEKVQNRHDTDRELLFRQESNFAYLTGVEVPGSIVQISYEHYANSAFDETKVKSKLFLPLVDKDSVMWSGLPPTVQELASKSDFTEIIEGVMPAQITPTAFPLPTFVHSLPGVKFDKSAIATINGPKHSTLYLLAAIQRARRTKAEIEIEFMKKAQSITEGAHIALMKGVGRGIIKDENDAESIFVAHCRKLGSKHQAYLPIVGSGEAAGTLHYIANSANFNSPGLLLVDAGCEVNNYASDITRCIPIGNGGKFTKECREIYEVVLLMQSTALEMIKPGASYEEIQLEMHRVVAREFLKLGIFVGASVEEILKEGLSAAVYPHGVGHSLGLDVHDVGCLPNGHSKDPLMKYLRLRVPLEKDFVVTVEPGVYFNEHLFADHVNSPHVNHELLEKYKYVGGVRIEDNLLITSDGFINLSAGIPKTIAEIEAITTGSD